MPRFGQTGDMGNDMYVMRDRAPPRGGSSCHRQGEAKGQSGREVLEYWGGSLLLEDISNSGGSIEDFQALSL